MNQRFYHAGQFAKRAAVSVRTLHYYDEVGVLSPTHHTDAGHRLYTEESFFRLQQILALKFIGLSLEEIKEYLTFGPSRLQEALALQNALVQEKKAQLEIVLEAIKATQVLLQRQEFRWEAIIDVIQVIQQQKMSDWWRKYFGEVSQKKIDEYQNIQTELRHLVETGQDPAGTEAEAFVRRWERMKTLLLYEEKGDWTDSFQLPDPEIQEGMKKLFLDVDAHPELEKASAEQQIPFLKQFTQKEGDFLQKALEIHGPKREESSDTQPSHTDRERQTKAVLALLHGEQTIEQICRQYNVAPGRLKNWKDIFIIRIWGEILLPPSLSAQEERISALERQVQEQAQAIVELRKMLNGHNA